MCFRIAILSQGGEEVTHQVHTLEIGGANPSPATNLARSYNGHYVGLSIRSREFDSPTSRQTLIQGGRMYNVNIHPWSDTHPNETVVIASYAFESRDEAVEFVDHYNAYSLIKVALLVEDDLEVVA